MKVRLEEMNQLQQAEILKQEKLTKFKQEYEGRVKENKGDLKVR